MLSINRYKSVQLLRRR